MSVFQERLQSYYVEKHMYFKPPFRLKLITLILTIDCLFNSYIFKIFYWNKNSGKLTLYTLSDWLALSLYNSWDSGSSFSFLSPFLRDVRRSENPRGVHNLPPVSNRVKISAKIWGGYWPLIPPSQSDGSVSELPSGMSVQQFITYWYHPKVLHYILILLRYLHNRLG